MHYNIHRYLVTSDTGCLSSFNALFFLMVFYETITRDYNALYVS